MEIAGQNGRIRLATFNLKHGAPPKGNRGRPERVMEACASLEADVLALQEVDKNVGRSKYADLAALAAEASGMSVIFEHTMPYKGGLYGNALLVRGEIVDDEVMQLPTGCKLWGRREPRNAIFATVQVRSHRLSVAATHLSGQRRVSKRQLAQVARAVTQQPGPHVLMGDLNRNFAEVANSPAADSLEFIDGPPTFPSTGAVERIDHIAISGLKLCASEVVPLGISDHLALIADVE